MAGFSSESDFNLLKISWDSSNCRNFKAFLRSLSKVKREDSCFSFVSCSFCKNSYSRNSFAESSYSRIYLRGSEFSNKSLRSSFFFMNSIWGLNSYLTSSKHFCFKETRSNSNYLSTNCLSWNKTSPRS